MRTRFALAAPVALVLVGVLGIAQPASADGSSRLDPAGLEQTVLRVQPPNALGAWTQNLYGTTHGSAPEVCWSAKGSPVTLPEAAVEGLVGYQVSQFTGLGVSIYQYRDQSSADAALAALKRVDCPDSAKVRLDVGPGNVVPAQQGSDFMNAAMDSYGSGVTYTDTEGVKTMELTLTTQRGLAVIQTTVSLAGSEATAKRLNRADRMNRRWHAQVVAAYVQNSQDHFA